MIDLEGVKSYLRIDIADDDGSIQVMLDAAVSYLENAGVRQRADSEIYDLAVCMLVSHWYENREAVGKTDCLVFGLLGIIHQLRLSDEGSGNGANREDAGQGNGL